MQRLDPETLTAHLEVALATAPQRTLENFRSSDAYDARASADLARHLAEQLARLEFTIGADWADPHEQQLLFNGKF